MEPLEYTCFVCGTLFVARNRRDDVHCPECGVRVGHRFASYYALAGGVVIEATAHEVDEEARRGGLVLREDVIDDVKIITHLLGEESPPDRRIFETVRIAPGEGTTLAGAHSIEEAHARHVEAVHNEFYREETDYGVQERETDDGPDRRDEFRGFGGEPGGAAGNDNLEG